MAEPMNDDAMNSDLAADGKQVRLLLEQLHTLLAEMGVLQDEMNSADENVATEEKMAELESLGTKADDLRARITRLRAIAAKDKEIRETLSASASAKTVRAATQPAATPSEDRSMTPPASTPAPYAVPRIGHIRGFGSDADAVKRAFAVGQWALGFLFGKDSARRWCAENGIMERRDQSEGSAAAGGNLIPVILSDTVIQLINQYGAFRPNVKVQPMPGPYLEIPRRTGGLTAYPMGEAQATTVSTKNWDKIALTARKWGTEVRLSNEVLADAVIDLASDLTEEMARAFAFAEDSAGFNGDGSSSYQSITGIIPAMAATTTTGSGQSAVTVGKKGMYTSAAATSFETLSIADFTYALATLPLYAKQNAKWYISPVGWAAAMQRLALTSGAHTGLSGGNTQANLEQGMGPSFMGYPVVLCNALDQTLGTDNNKVKVIFGDLSQGVVMGMLRDITYRTSTERLFELDQTVMLATERFDVKVHGTGSATEAGPIVCLRTKAA